jgi:glucosamine-6-phosphate deaminase
MTDIASHRQFQKLKAHIFESKIDAGIAAAKNGADLIRKAIADRGEASIIVATGASQFEMLTQLVQEPDIDWYHVTAFHLDEYVDLPITHPASFRGYLWQRFVSQLPTPLKAFHYLNGDQNVAQECARVGDLIKQHTIDVAFVGIGENGHLAFNDPPADFKASEPFREVDLDEKCRLQQFNEGWFPSLESVPRRAITMTIPQIMKSTAIICTVPDERKALAVQHCLRGEVSPQWPASILQQHDHVDVYLDAPAAQSL